MRQHLTHVREDDDDVDAANDAVDNYAIAENVNFVGVTITAFNTEPSRYDKLSMLCHISRFIEYAH